MNLLRKSLDTDPSAPMVAWGHLILRAAIGVMVFYVHGWHKLEGLIAYLQQGAPWKLAEEVAGMHFPAPFPSAVAATIVQFICSLFVTVGLFTRINAALLSGVLGVAILQNLLAARDPQLTILYVLIMVTLIFLGGGRFSIDARLFSRERSLPPVTNAVTKAYGKTS
jgi:putative oxidoreductase